MKVSIYDVAKKAGVSVVTVSRVINGASSVREGNREKVLAAMKALNYSPNAAARSLARGSTNVIGIVIPSYMDPFFFDIITSVEKYLEKRGYFLAVSLDTRETTGESECFLFQQERVDGIILVTPMFEEVDIPVLKNKNIPFVVIDSQSSTQNMPAIMVDNYVAGRKAARHLIDLGHTKVAHVGGPLSLLTSRERLEGFKDELAANGISPVSLIEADYNINDGMVAMLSLLESVSKGNTMPTAIFAGDDNIAFGIIDVARQHGLSVPEDLSVIGFDDHPYGASLTPNLTTFRQPGTSLSEKAVDMLFKVMENGTRRIGTVRLDADLIVRDSTCPPKR